MTMYRNSLATIATLLMLGCSSEETAAPPAATTEAPAPAAAPAAATLAPLTVSCSYWIECSPVLVAANSFYPTQIMVGEGGIPRITANQTDMATNAETQILRESLNNPDLRIIATVTESFYRLVARKSAGISTLADLKGKRVMLPRNTSANYYLVAMLATVGLTEEDVTLVALPPDEGDVRGMDKMSDALLAGEVDVISIWEPEPDDALKQLGDDGIEFQDRSVYREVFNIHARATDLANPEKRAAIVEFIRAIDKANKALAANPDQYYPHISSITRFSEDEIRVGWPEMEFPLEIIPDMLDVLETEEKWVAKERSRTPRTRAELEYLIDRSVVAEALATP
ncbi:MAG: ABC transporter substrate-binding protein [Pseudomonadota bacterium]